MRSCVLLLPALLLSACAGSMVPPCDLEGEWPYLVLGSEAWPDGAVSTDEDGQERVDLNAELTVTAVDTSADWTGTLGDGDGAELQLSALSETGAAMPEVGDVLEVRYSRWHVGDDRNEDDSFLRMTRVGGSMFAWAASATTVDDLEVPDDFWLESGQEICREVGDDRTSWHSSLLFGGEYETAVEVEPTSSVRIGDWDVTNALNRRTHFTSSDEVDTWAVEVVGFLFE